METNAKQQVVERIKAANNVLVTVSSSPTVDQLASAIGLTLLLNKLGKHSTTVFSGEVPSTIEFLQPEKTIEKNTDSLRDFIISLDKSKADKLRYKVEDEMVKIFITPYRTSISEADLEFGQGDFNVDVVVALGVLNKDELDQAIMAHGRILHDATVISLMAGEQASNLGSINWQDTAASSLCEMLVSISESFGSGLLDTQVATSFLTGIVAQTERFKNEKTTPKVLTMSAQLVAAGANQQLIATELETPPPPPVPEPQLTEQAIANSGEAADAQQSSAAPSPEPEAPRTEVEVGLTHEEPPIGIEVPEHTDDIVLPAPQSQDDTAAQALDFAMHEDNQAHGEPQQEAGQPSAEQQHENTQASHEDTLTEHPEIPAGADQKPAGSDLGLIEITHQPTENQQEPVVDHTVSPIQIDEHGNIMGAESAPGQPESSTEVYTEQPSPQPAVSETPPAIQTDLPVVQPSASAPDMNLAPSDSLGSGGPAMPSSAENQSPAQSTDPSHVSHGLLPSQPPGSEAGPAMSGAMEDASNEPPDAADILNLPPLDGRFPEAAPQPSIISNTSPQATIQPTSQSNPAEQPAEDNKPVESIDDARNAVMSAIGAAPFDTTRPEPLERSGATLLPDVRHDAPQAPAPDAATGATGQNQFPTPVMPQPNIIAPQPNTPPPGPPPIMPPIITTHGGPLPPPPSPGQTPPQTV